MTRKLLISITTLLLCFAATGSLCAQEEEEIATYKANMAQAVQLFNEGNLTQSLQIYLEQRARLVDIPPTEIDYSLARTYQKLYQCKDASEYYNKILTNPDLSPEDDIFERAVQGYDEISECANWSKVTVKCSVDVDHILYIDNNPLGQCWNRPYSVPAGKHRFSIKTGDGRETKGFLTLKDGEDSEIKLTVAPLEKIVEKKIDKGVDVSTEGESKDKFSPHLYWGLIAGGALLAGGSGYFAAMSYSGAYDLLLAKSTNAGQEAEDAASSKIKTGNMLTGVFAGVGGALALTGAALAIVNVVLKNKAPATTNETTTEEESIEDVQAFVSPTSDGGVVGFGFQF